MTHRRRLMLLVVSGCVSAGCAEPPTAEPNAIAPPARDQPTKLIRKPSRIANEYIVVLTRDRRTRIASEVNDVIDALAARHRATVMRRYTAALHGFAARMTEQDAAALADDPDVAYVEENGRVHAAVVQTGATWGLDRVDQESLPLDTKYTQGGQGQGVTVYMVDTGIRSTHGEFAGRIMAGHTAVNDGNGTEDCFYHGTHTAGTVAGTTYGVAKQATLVPVRVLDCTGNGSVDQVVDGLEWVAANHVLPAVANMSLVLDTGYDSVDEAVRNIIAGGVVVVVAAGNNGVDACFYSPGREPMAITVGSTTMADARSSFSNYGTCVDISAPGSDITSASNESDAATKTGSGTSFASPHVAGAAAIYLAAHPTATPADVTAALLGDATVGKLTGLLTSPNTLLRINASADMTPPVVSIESPADGGKVPTDFTVVVSATDDDLAAVALAVDGTVIETKTADPFEFHVTGGDGPHTIAAVATDGSGNTASDQINVTVEQGAADPGGSKDDAGKGSGGCSTTGVGGGSWLLLLGLAWIARRGATCRRPTG